MNYAIQKKTYSYHLGLIKGLTHAPHIHTHLELVYLCKGKAIAYLDGRQYKIHSGELFLAFPNQVHYYEVIEPVEAVLSIFCADMHPDLNALIENRLPVCPVIPGEQWQEPFLRLLPIRHTQNPYEKLHLTAALLELFAQILEEFTYAPVTQSKDSLEKVIAYCQQHYARPLTLNDLSQALYLSRYHISHLFGKQLNMGFNKYLNTLRIHQAKKELLTKKAVSQVALDCGFSSVRTFNRAFREIAGITPRQYIQENSDA